MPAWDPPPFTLLATIASVEAPFLSVLVLLVRRWRAQRHREESALSLAGIGAVVIVALDGIGEFNLGVPAVSGALACVIGLAIAAGEGSPREQSWTPPTTAA